MQVRARPEMSQSELLSLVAAKLLDLGSETVRERRFGTSVGFWSPVRSFAPALTVLAPQSKQSASGRQQSVSDSVALLPALAECAAADVRFTRIHDFDYAPELAVFDLLDVFLVHGLLVDAADTATAGAWLCARDACMRPHGSLVCAVTHAQPFGPVLLAAVGTRSHSQLLERIQELRASGEAAATVRPINTQKPSHLFSPPHVRRFIPYQAEVSLLSGFLSSASTGMTSAGLKGLLCGVPDRQLCVLQRGVGYVAAFKREEAFYCLLCDEEGCSLGTGGAVWEQVVSCDGATVLTDGAFQPLVGPTGAPLGRMAPHALGAPPAPPGGGGVGGTTHQGGVPSLPHTATATPSQHLSSASPAAAAAAAAALAALSLRCAAPSHVDALSGEAGSASAATMRDHALALRLQEAYEEQERAARKAVRQAASRLQQQQERGAGGEDSNEVREFVTRVETHVKGNCVLM